MPSITFDLETVTPLFLAGADQATAELRPPAFRGALRYWFRAIAGGYHWNNPAQLKEIESALLGDTTETNGASKIILRLSQVPQFLPLQALSVNDKLGLKYLWFSMEMTRRKAIGIDEPLRFSLSFSTRPNPHNIEQQQKNLLIAANCFWLAVNLGGFGSRERRGAGSLRVLRVTHQGLDEGLATEKLPRFDIKFRPEIVRQYFRSEIRKVENNCCNLLNLGERPNIEAGELPAIELYRPDISTIFWVKHAYKNWEDALDHIGNQYSAYRGNQPLRSRTVFGLPLTRVDMDSRRPSPLRIKIVKSVNDYFCFLSRTYADFPAKSGISDRTQFQLIDDFINNLDHIEKVI